jgi:hypothetical protein
MLEKDDKMTLEFPFAFLFSFTALRKITCGQDTVCRLSDSGITLTFQSVPNK